MFNVQDKRLLTINRFDSSELRDENHLSMIILLLSTSVLITL